MRVLCFGDSNTYGYDPRSYFGDRYPAQTRWTDQLARNTGWDVMNFGVNGRSIPSQPVSLPEADTLIIMLGSNDLLCGCSAQEASLRMERFLLSVLNRYPNILLIAPPPMQYGDWVAEERLIRESSLLGTCYQSLAAQLGIGFADAGEWDVALTFDGVHFSESGHHAFSNGILQALKQIT